MIYHGDCLEVLPTLPADSVDAVVTDPPYHLTAMSKRWGQGGAARKPTKAAPFQRHNAGFMGQQWDGGDIAFRPETWAMMARVMRPGALLVAFGGSRTWHRLACAIEDGGLTVRDTLAYLYGSGFPKSKSLLKPAFEPIVLAMKDGPLQPLNIDACRIEAQGRPLREIDPKASANGPVYAGRRQAGTGFDGGSRAMGSTDLGRWPANVVLDTEAAELLDKQSGNRPSGNEGKEGHRRQAPRENGGIYGGGKGLWRSEGPAGNLYGDDGGASRFFYTSKANSTERNVNQAQRNSHPTVKPVDLMIWLCKLVTPPGGTILDPFLGSGTTAIAAVELGFDWIGIEREAEYVAIAKDRIGMFCEIAP